MLQLLVEDDSAGNVEPTPLQGPLSWSHLAQPVLGAWEARVRSQLQRVDHKLEDTLRRCETYRLLLASRLKTLEQQPQQQVHAAVHSQSTLSSRPSTYSGPCKVGAPYSTGGDASAPTTTGEGEVATATTNGPKLSATGRSTSCDLDTSTALTTSGSTSSSGTTEPPCCPQPTVPPVGQPVGSDLVQQAPGPSPPASEVQDTVDWLPRATPSQNAGKLTATPQPEAQSCSNSLASQHPQGAPPKAPPSAPEEAQTSAPSAALPNRPLKTASSAPPATRPSTPSPASTNGPLDAVSSARPGTPPSPPSEAAPCSPAVATPAPPPLHVADASARQQNLQNQRRSAVEAALSRVTLSRIVLLDKLRLRKQAVLEDMVPQLWADLMQLALCNAAACVALFPGVVGDERGFTCSVVGRIQGEVDARRRWVQEVFEARAARVNATAEEICNRLLAMMGEGHVKAGA